MNEKVLLIFKCLDDEDKVIRLGIRVSFIVRLGVLSYQGFYSVVGTS